MADATELETLIVRLAGNADQYYSMLNQAKAKTTSAANTLEAEAKRMLAGLQTPLQKFQVQQTKIQQMFSAGLLGKGAEGATNYQALLRKASDEADGVGRAVERIGHHSMGGARHIRHMGHAMGGIALLMSSMSGQGKDVAEVFSQVGTAGILAFSGYGIIGASIGLMAIGRAISNIKTEAKMFREEFSKAIGVVLSGSKDIKAAVTESHIGDLSARVKDTAEYWHDMQEAVLPVWALFRSKTWEYAQNDIDSFAKAIENDMNKSVAQKRKLEEAMKEPAFLRVAIEISVEKFEEKVRDKVEDAQAKMRSMIIPSSPLALGPDEGDRRVPKAFRGSEAMFEKMAAQILRLGGPGRETAEAIGLLRNAVAGLHRAEAETAVVNMRDSIEDNIDAVRLETDTIGLNAEMKKRAQQIAKLMIETGMSEEQAAKALELQLNKQKKAYMESAVEKAKNARKDLWNQAKLDILVLGKTASEAERLKKAWELAHKESITLAEALKLIESPAVKAIMLQRDLDKAFSETRVKMEEVEFGGGQLGKQLRQLARDGASPEQLESIRRLDQQNQFIGEQGKILEEARNAWVGITKEIVTTGKTGREALEALANAFNVTIDPQRLLMEDWKEARKIMEDIRLPMDKFNQRLQTLRRLQEEGLFGEGEIGARNFGLAVAKAQKSILGATDAMKGFQATSFGSAEAIARTTEYIEKGKWPTGAAATGFNVAPGTLPGGVGPAQGAVVDILNKILTELKKRDNKQIELKPANLNPVF